MQSPEEILKELEETPKEFLTPVETDFKPQIKVDDSIAGSLGNGKDDIQEGQTDEGITNNPGATTETGTPVTPGGPGPTPGSDDGVEFNAAEFVTTDMALSLLGFIIMFVGLWALDKFGHIKSSNDELELTAEEKKTLKKPIDKCLETINLKNINPWFALIICIVIIYGLKFTGIIMKHKEKDAELKSREDQLKERERKMTEWENTPDEHKRPAQAYKAPEQQTIPFTPVYNQNSVNDLTPRNNLGFNQDGTPKKDGRGRPKKQK